MASESSTTGGAPAAAAMSAAEQLMQQHAAEETHKVTVEDVPDEDTLAHPPPSGANSLPISTDPSRVATPSAEPTMSSKLAGKQAAREPAAVPNKPALDTQSEELFPALGAPKTQQASSAPSMWSKKPAAVGKASNVVSNGVANGVSGTTVNSSRASTPMSGVLTPSSTAPSQRGPTQMSLPGRYSEQIPLHPSEMIPRNELKKPVQDILRDITKRSKATVEMKSGPGGVVVFSELVTGKDPLPSSTNRRTRNVLS